MSVSAFVESLHQFLEKDQISENETIREQHSIDESYHKGGLTQVVVFPRSTEDTAQILKAASRHAVPVVPFGLGTSLEGHVVPLKECATIDFIEMNAVLDVSPDDLMVTVQPGVTRSQLNRELKKHGLFFSVDPGADATLGGMAATNASGTTSVRYGVMRDQVRDLEVVLASGEVIHTGSRAAKSSAGLHLNGLFVGSEGILGCITELTLKVYGIPEFEMAGRATFKSVENAVQAVVSLLQSGIPIARVELLDEISLKQLNHHQKTDYPEIPTLFMEFHGNEDGLAQDVEFMKEIVAMYDCEAIEFVSNHAERTRLWEARHNLAYSFIHGFPGRKMMVTDVCVPISELAGAVRHAQEKLLELNLIGGVTGHVGDGNFHVILMIDLSDSEEKVRANIFNESLVAYGLERNGTSTGEHGVGYGKQKYMQREFGAALGVMQQIKSVLDPQGILNPGKLLPAKGDAVDESVSKN
ncbi:FAD-binding oxidoreductase [Jeotgalibacillus proteolyticus]|uniref:D-lactate dehydrogenase (cytochrome) n=1 Tax=Jeotgalibacillus proteolyticus TaxID=2082395 RepID=A0A2S5GDW9_9BACL|nr:FAD-linked oxidase C-terminal domain-containing protein [Jeotgalibacillus proteolyticus]PPA71104.1 2-hydroxy-acid oxidase [Jeotgalibacillus proteolyticus]